MTPLSFRPILGVAFLLLLSSEAFAQSHNYLNYRRSSTTSHFFVQQGIEGEFGTYSTKGNEVDAQGIETEYTDDQAWKGFGIGTEFGLEVMKFVQFRGGHTFVNMQHKDDRFESLRGSRLNAGLSLVFMAPVFNLEAGAGLQGSQLDYQRRLENATFHGSGYYQSLGLNYFISSRVSVYFNAKMSREHLARTGGSSAVKDMDTEMTSMGLGFRIWL